jgi:two-component system, OmpR family, sensor kinase
MLRSLRVRLVAVFMVPVIVAGGLSLILATRTVSNDARDRAERILRSQSVGVAEVFGAATFRFFEDTSKPAALSPPIQKITAADIYYVSKPDALFACNGCLIPTWPALTNRLDWAALGRGQQQSFEATPPGSPNRSLVVASVVWQTPTGTPPASSVQEPIGAILLARPLSQLAPTQGFFEGQLLPAFLAGVGAAALLGILLGFRITRPLRWLAQASARVARGQFDVQLDYRRRDEIGQLNRAFAAMAAELHETRELQRQFLMRVSHELRTPLTAIEGHVGALADGIYETPAERDEAYSVLAAEAARLERLIADLLDLAKLEAGRFALRRDEVRIDQLLDVGVSALREQARNAGVELALEAGDGGIVIGDGDRILQILTNLVANAIRWTPPGGVVRVRASTSGTDARISVADSGPGIPPAKRTVVFSPFYSEQGGGTGLGLAIANELAVAMGGAIRIDDADEGGALFTVTLPRHTPSRLVVTARS